MFPKFINYLGKCAYVLCMYYYYIFVYLYILYHKIILNSNFMHKFKDLMEHFYFLNEFFKYGKNKQQNYKIGLRKGRGELLYLAPSKSPETPSKWAITDWKCLASRWLNMEKDPGPAKPRGSKVCFQSKCVFSQWKKWSACAGLCNREAPGLGWVMAVKQNTMRVVNHSSQTPVI